MTEILVVVADRRIMREIIRGGRLTFVYDDRWRSMDAAYPLSLLMPLVVAEHGHARIEPWLWGLLPDNEAFLARWGQRFHVSPRNAFALLAAVGEDCPGAIQLVRVLSQIVGCQALHLDAIAYARISTVINKIINPTRSKAHSRARSRHSPCADRMYLNAVQL